MFAAFRKLRRGEVARRVRDATVTRPAQELKAVARVSLAPGERRTLRFELPAEAFSLLSADLTRVTEPGDFRVSAGRGAVSQQVRLLARAT